MTLQVTESTTAGKVHTSTTRSSSITPQETAEVECKLQQYGTPKLYCYPRVRAHSTLLVCFRTLESFGSVWPHKILCNGFTLNKKVITAVRKHGVRSIQKSNHTTENKPSVDVQLTQYLYPGSEMVLVSDSTVSMMDALLRHLCVSQGTTVFLPGILLHPYFNLLQLFDQWMLRVVGYDVDTVTMFADENDIRKKAVKLGLLAKTKKKETTGHREYRSIVLLIGLGGRFLMNTKRMVNFSRREIQAITVELHPVKAVTLTPSEDNKGSGMSMYADVHITSMDAAGELGGAVAFTPDPLLAQGIFTQLQKQRPLMETRKHWVMLARHIVHVLISDGISFHIMLQAVQLWSLIAHALDIALVRMHLGRRKRQQQQQQQQQPQKPLISHKEIEQKEKTKNVVNQNTITNADKIFKFIMKSRVTEVPIPPISENSNNYKQSETCIFSKPHRAAIQWMMHAAAVMQRRVEKECFSLWEFLTHLRNDVEVVSCGEPQTPWNCVMGYSDHVMLRVRSPHLAAQALRTAGFDAVAAITYVWHSSGYTNDKKSNSNGTSKNDNKSGKRNNSNNNNNSSNINSSNSYSSQWKGDLLTLREVVLLPECPQCEALAQHILFLPLYPEMTWKNRQKLHSVMQATFPSSLFKSPSEKFIQHVMNTPNRHFYRSTEVSALIASWLQHKGGKETFFADPQPLLLWALLGPAPSYLLSKL
ncbi:hypothetical protein LSM04_008181 [Trypanosoma melophagium]|uniref:uncharacterized protein n=1 Tax=Trypanosoma melophagium TaxID=715481 RepID=UPI00351AACF3|nr:hypothetical protein LSM04_008181 [Trypanosoma melophagium]